MVQCGQILFVAPKCSGRRMGHRRVLPQPRALHRILVACAGAAFWAAGTATVLIVLLLLFHVVGWFRRRRLMRNLAGLEQVAILWLGLAHTHAHDGGAACSEHDLSCLQLTIEKALSRVPGVTSTKVDLESRDSHGDVFDGSHHGAGAGAHVGHRCRLPGYAKAHGG